MAAERPKRRPHAERRDEEQTSVRPNLAVRQGLAKLLDPFFGDFRLGDHEVRKRGHPGQRIERGQLLYENHCMGCHESVVYIRTRRLIKSLPELHEETGRWATYTNLPWGKEELEDVVEFLNSRFYKY